MAGVLPILAILPEGLIVGTVCLLLFWFVFYLYDQTTQPIKQTTITGAFAPMEGRAIKYLRHIIFAIFETAIGAEFATAMTSFVRQGLA